LLQRRRVRVLVAGALVIGHLAIVGLGFVLLLWLFAPMKFIAALGVLVAASFVAWVVAVGRWSHGVAMAMQVAASTLYACPTSPSPSSRLPPDSTISPLDLRSRPLLARPAS